MSTTAAVPDATPPCELDPLVEPLTLHPYGAPGNAAREAMRSASEVMHLGVHVAATIDWAVWVGHRTPPPGGKRTALTWEVLSSAAARDVSAARVLEPHLDALAILGQAREAGVDVDAALERVDADHDSSWGVFAAEGSRLSATRAADGWRLDGTKEWCSLAGDISHALVTAWTGPDTRGLFAVRLRHHEAATAHRGPWVSRGLNLIVSAPVTFADAPAEPIGGDDWYLTRPGFPWGGMGVAAVWWGATAPLVRAIVERARRDRADQIAHHLAGEADTAFWATRALLAEAAGAIDEGVSGRDLDILGERLRAQAAGAAERILSLADRALGPVPLMTNEDHARRVADLRIYLRQHHGERDLARLGRLLADG